MYFPSYMALGSKIVDYISLCIAHGGSEQRCELKKDSLILFVEYVSYYYTSDYYYACGGSQFLFVNYIVGRTMSCQLNHYSLIFTCETLKPP